MVQNASKINKTTVIFSFSKNCGVNSIFSGPISKSDVNLFSQTAINYSGGKTQPHLPKGKDTY
jgi:hypothetical protein